MYTVMCQLPWHAAGSECTADFIQLYSSSSALQLLPMSSTAYQTLPCIPVVPVLPAEVLRPPPAATDTL
jgi:hypothetical protein